MGVNPEVCRTVERLGQTIGMIAIPFGCCVFSRVASAKLGVLVQMPLWLVRTLEESDFFHIVGSTDSDAGLSYVAFSCACNIEWRLVPMLCHCPFSPYCCSQMNVSYLPAIEGL